MDKKLFEQRLTEVADWQIPDTLTATSSGQVKRPRGRPSNEEVYQEAHEEIFLELFDGKNPTFPPKVTAIKCQSTHCEECGDHCPNGRQLDYKIQRSKTKSYWRSRCRQCNKTLNPYTGLHDLSAYSASQVWAQFCRETKGAYKTKANKLREQSVINTLNKTVIEDEHERITFYHQRTDLE